MGFCAADAPPLPHDDLVIPKPDSLPYPYHPALRQSQRPLHTRKSIRHGYMTINNQQAYLYAYLLFLLLRGSGYRICTLGPEPASLRRYMTHVSFWFSATQEELNHAIFTTGAKTAG